jgi:Peptidase A4 family.
MRWQTLLPLFSFPGPSFSELTFTVTAHHNGVPIPPSDIRIEPYPFGQTVHTTGGKLVSASGLPTLKNLRANNPTVNSNNWCGSVNYAPIGRQIRLVHGYFQHPVCEIRNGMKTFPQAVAAWVGIDGDTWTDSLLQAGTVCKVCDMELIPLE